MQKSINGLSPGSTYIIQVASIDGQGQSDWSPTLQITIPKPVLTPNPPTNVTATGNPDNIKISWTQATLNTDNTSLAQPASYYIYKSSYSTGLTNLTSMTPVGISRSSSFEYPSLDYGITQYFKVQTRDGFDNTSTGSSQVFASPISPAVMNGLISNISAYSRSAGTSTTFTTKDTHNLEVGDKVYIHGTKSMPATITSITATNSILEATTSSAHNFSVGDSVEIIASGAINERFNERVVVTATSTSPSYTFSYMSSTSGFLVGTASAVAVDGLSTVNTLYGSPVAVASIISPTQFTCSPNLGTHTTSCETVTMSITGIALTGSGKVEYNVGAIGNTIVGQRVSISGILPDQYNVTDAVITSITSNKFTIASNSSGSYISGGTAIARPFGDEYPSANAVRIRDDGITIGNMSKGFIVGISPTSFNMQSSGDSTRLALSSSHIDMYKNGEKTVQFDGNTGDATIIGKFSTGFEPAARVVLDSGALVPESISFYSGSPEEISPGYIAVEQMEDIGVRAGSYKEFASALTTVGGQVADNKSLYLVDEIPLPTATLTTTSTSNFPTSGVLDIESSAGWQSIVYTGKTSTEFTGCTGGTGIAGQAGMSSKIGARIYYTPSSPFTYSTVPNSGNFWSDAINSSGELAYISKTTGSSAITITDITGSGAGTRTVTTSGNHGYFIGDQVSITGVTPSTINENAFVKSVPSLNTFTYTSTKTGTRSGGGGTVTLYPSLRGVYVTDAGTGATGYASFTGNSKLYGYPKYGQVSIYAPAVEGASFNDAGYIELTSAKIFASEVLEPPSINLSGKIRLPYSSSGDASLISTDHALQIGATESFNLVMDNNEIMARVNGGTGNLILNAEGGNVSINGVIARGSSRGIVAAGVLSTSALTFITHSLNTTPVSVVANPRENTFANPSTSFSIKVGNFSSTTFSVFAVNASNAAVSPALSWIASA